MDISVCACDEINTDVGYLMGLYHARRCELGGLPDAIAYLNGHDTYAGRFSYDVKVSHMRWASWEERDRALALLEDGARWVDACARPLVEWAAEYRREWEQVGRFGGHIVIAGLGVSREHWEDVFRPWDTLLEAGDYVGSYRALLRRVGDSLPVVDAGAVIDVFERAIDVSAVAREVVAFDAACAAGVAIFQDIVREES